MEVAQYLLDIYYTPTIQRWNKSAVTQITHTYQQHTHVHNTHAHRQYTHTTRAHLHCPCYSRTVTVNTWRPVTQVVNYNTCGRYINLVSSLTSAIASSHLGCSPAHGPVYKEQTGRFHQIIRKGSVHMQRAVYQDMVNNIFCWTKGFGVLLDMFSFGQANYTCV